MTCFSWCGYVIDWEAWAAIGSILGALATFIAAYIALYLPRRERLLKAIEEEAAGKRKMRDAATMLLPLCKLLISHFDSAESHLRIASPNAFGLTLLPPVLEVNVVDQLSELVPWMDWFETNARADLAKLIGWCRLWNAAFYLKDIRNGAWAKSVHDADSIGFLMKLRNNLAETAESLERWAQANEWAQEERSK